MAPPKNTDAPPAPEAGVVAIKRSITINAPKERVWEILTDFSKYNEWDPFARDMMLTDKSKKPLNDQTLAPGKHLIISFCMPPSLTAQPKPAFELITHVDHTAHRIAWRNVDMPAWLLWGDRWQTVEDDGSGGARYECYEVFGGLFAYVVRWFMKGHLEEAFEALGKTLKERAENPKAEV
ncbi:hypothetical protein GLOTRDRAFT_138644 [Gloeophyllum trabeum ATCC 11539]|uniref:Coenzyme Q-binding protein COQ10 START domain-containing protein n=1 Tax=Gloeophyllum trabeum (strain ATCC 11539 / FP-39264 / Madison 617) TaxID=670483 RepID=S7RS98_GLOTA|nr:uncharacterized protein GLOTRDRAFT_138644 [Gloeophyllum trabeum ATCC 11539]EPQ55909.1 hypothetical protein GLOTRDRAFT_138644 [Gloeophyllum trabeum ATCC 11539]